MGGQEGDCGIIKGANGVFEVEDTINSAAENTATSVS